MLLLNYSWALLVQDGVPFLGWFTWLPGPVLPAAPLQFSQSEQSCGLGNAGIPIT